jgi:transposase
LKVAKKLVQEIVHLQLEKRRLRMDRFIGIDVHKDSCTVAVMGPSGKRIRCEVVETNGAALVELIRLIPKERRVCIEESGQSAWLREILQPHVSEVVVEGTTERKDRSQQKNDEKDAWGLADRLRTGTVKNRVFGAPRELSELRDAVRAYGIVVRDLVRTKNRLQAIYRSRGIAVEGDAIYRKDDREEQLAKLPEGRRLLAELLSRELDAQEALKAEAEERVEAKAQAHPTVARLMTVPGLGLIRAAQVVAIGITPKRFRTLRQFWSYCGLAVVMHTSSDWVRQDGRWIRSDNVSKTRGLTRKRQPTLKAVFKGAATVVVGRMKEHPLTSKYQQLCDAGTKPSLAMLTIARKLAATVFAMWRNEEAYDPGHRASQPQPT